MLFLLSDRYKRPIVAIFFGLLFLGGLRLVPDYGMGYDEEQQRIIGEVSLLYVFKQLPPALQQRLLSPQQAALLAAQGPSHELRTFRDRDHGVAFELPAAAIEQLLRPADWRTIFLLRHYLNFLVCFAGIVVFYQVATQLFASWRMGLLGAVLLVLSPRLFADYFYNSKDPVFMMLYLAAAATAILFVKRPGWRTALCHALVCALAIDVRLMGVLVPAATLALVGLRALHRAYAWRVAGFVAVYLAALAGFVVLLWPYLWEAPVPHLLVAWHSLSQYRQWGGSVLYQGQLVVASRLPWHYSLVWIGLTVPLAYLFFWGIGLLGVVRKLWRARWRLYTSPAEWQDLFFLSLGLGPLAAIIVLHSVIYGGWRHLYFVYPMLLLLTLRGLAIAWHWRPAPVAWRPYWRPTIGLIMGCALAGVVVRMVRLHPLENLYFNALSPKPVAQYYETDYWSLGMAQGLQWVVQHDQRPHIRIGSNTLTALAQQLLLLPAADRQRLAPTTDTSQLDYYIDNFSYLHPPRHTQPRYTLWADDIRVLSIYQSPGLVLHQPFAQ